MYSTSGKGFRKYSVCRVYFKNAKKEKNNDYSSKKR